MKPSIALKILIIVYLVGLAGFLLPSTASFFSSLTAGTILFSFVFLLFFHKEWSAAFVLTLLVIAVCGFLIEYIGVQTGRIFGRYDYGQNLGLKLLGIPLLKGVNWFMLIYASRAIIQKFIKNTLLLSLLASLLMLVYDYFLEQFAIHNDLWSWAVGQPPLHNFIGWFVCSFVIHIIYANARKQVDNPIAGWLFFIQLLFFAAIGLVNGWIPYTPQGL